MNANWTIAYLNIKLSFGSLHVIGRFYDQVGLNILLLAASAGQIRNILTGTGDIWVKNINAADYDLLEILILGSLGMVQGAIVVLKLFLGSNRVL